MNTAQQRFDRQVEPVSNLWSSPAPLITLLLSSEQTTPNKPTHIDFLSGIFVDFLTPRLLLHDIFVHGTLKVRYSSRRASPGPLPSTCVSDSSCRKTLYNVFEIFCVQ